MLCHFMFSLYREKMADIDKRLEAVKDSKN